MCAIISNLEVISDLEIINITLIFDITIMIKIKSVLQKELNFVKEPATFLINSLSI